MIESLITVDRTHYDITEWALDRLGGFSNYAIAQFASHSEDPDADGILFVWPSAYHFIDFGAVPYQPPSPGDPEYPDYPDPYQPIPFPDPDDPGFISDMLVGWQRSVELIQGWRQCAKEALFNHLKNPLSPNFYFRLGVVFHIVSDNYAHSNWVEHTNTTIDGMDMDSDTFPIMPDGTKWRNQGNESKDHAANNTPNHNEAFEDAVNETIRQWYKIEDYIFNTMYPTDDWNAKNEFNFWGVTPGFKLTFPCQTQDVLLGQFVSLKLYALGIRPKNPFKLWLYRTENSQEVPVGWIFEGKIDHSWKGFDKPWEVGTYTNEDGIPCMLTPEECSFSYKLKIITNNEWETCELPISISSLQFMSPSANNKNWQMGTYKSIEWQRDNYIHNKQFILNILSSNNKIDKIIADNIYIIDDAYDWQVGVTQEGNLPPGDGYKLYLSEMDPMIPACMLFKFSMPFNITYFDITSPNGGEEWILGSPVTLKWTAPAGTSLPVKLVLLGAGGAELGTIVNNLNADNYQWTAGQYNGGTAPAGDDYRIRVYTASGPIYCNHSGIFSLQSAPTSTIAVTAPNGGESWVAGSGHAIAWTSSGDIQSFKLDYTTNNGGSWLTIAIVDATNHNYQWTVPATISSQYKVRISDTGGSGAIDDSDSTFSVTAPPAITVTSPNGGETWLKGSTHNITWSSTGSVVNVKIEYTVNNGTSWSPLIGSTPNSGTFSWTMPAEVSNQCKVRISDAGTSGATDVSNSTFTIADRVITVLSPNGGEKWLAGSSHNITWSSSGAIVNVKIEYTIDNGASWNQLTASITNNGTYGWLIPSGLSNQCKVRVSDVGSSASDVSNGAFTIADRAVTVTAPNGGEIWSVGSSKAITWTSSGAAIANVKIEYSTNGGSSWSAIYSSTANDGSEAWTVPNAPSGQCRVRISDASASTVKDISDADFSIVTVPTNITVTAPNGGESWKIGAVKNITWTSSGVGNTLEISLWQNGVDRGAIASSVNAATGTYAWTVGSGLTDVVSGTGCKIQVKENGTAVADSSDASFTITY